MIGQLDLYGVFIPWMAAFLISSYVLPRALILLLNHCGFYTLVWHPPLFNLALFITLLGGFSTAFSRFCQ